MNCFECQIDSGRITTAAGICSACGAAVCVEHATMDAVQVEVISVGNPSVQLLPGRLLHCSTCHAAIGRADARGHAGVLTAA